MAQDEGQGREGTGERLEPELAAADSRGSDFSRDSLEIAAKPLPYPFMQVISSKHVAPALAALFLSACASTGDRLVKVFEDRAALAAPYSRILVVGAHAEIGTRRTFENSVVRALAALGTEARSSLAVMNEAENIDRESVLAAVRETGADAVLVTRVVDIETQNAIEQGQTQAELARRNDVPLADFFRYEYTESADAMTVTTVRTVILDTDVYDAASEKKVWSVESTSFDKQTAYGVIDGVARAISAELARDELIQ